MNRIEKVREHIDMMLSAISDQEVRRAGFVHLYGVSHFCTLIALKRNENAELATIAGMLHDVSTYAVKYTEDYAKKGAIMARGMLTSLGGFMPEEIDLVCHAIANHSEKGKQHASFDEVLIDADVMHHCLYDPMFPVIEKEKIRFEALQIEFGLK